MVVFVFMEVFYAFGMIFAICELSQQICDGFEDMNRAMDQFHWPLYPIEVQRILGIVIIFTQQPTDFKVFGSIACCRDSFKKVYSIKSIFL